MLLADWKGQTGDAAFDAALRRALAMRLGESPLVRLLSSERVASTLTLMRRPPTTPVVDATAQEVCTRLGGDVVVEGEITTLGKKFVIVLEATGCGGGREVVPVAREAKDREDALAALDRAAAGLLEQLRYVRPERAAQPAPGRRSDAPPSRRRCACTSLAGDALAAKGRRGRRSASTSTP